MSARTAAKRTRVIPFNSEPFINCEWSTKNTHVAVRTGPRDASVECTIDLEVYDAENTDATGFPPRAFVGWNMERWAKGPDGQFRFFNDYPLPHTDMEYCVDEIESFATALYRAVQLAKQRRYLPNGEPRAARTA